MSDLGVALHRLIGDLTALGGRFSVVGGLARIYYAGARTTYDLDVAIAVSGDDEAEVLISQLRSQFGYVVGETIEHEIAERLATQRLVLPGPEAVTIDLLFASSGIEPEIVAASKEVEILEHLSAPVATLGHLIALKVLADRRKDRLDAEDLMALAQPADLHVATEALDLIERRGFQRGLDLREKFSAVLQSRMPGE